MNLLQFASPNNNILFYKHKAWNHIEAEIYFCIKHTWKVGKVLEKT